MSFAGQALSLSNLSQYTTIPALRPPVGVQPDFATHNDRADLFHILCGIMLILTYVFVSLRLYSKLWINHTGGLDDVAAVLAIFGQTVQFAILSIIFENGVGQHQWNVSLSQLPPIMQYGKYQSIILPITVLFIKLSLLLLYLRVFGPDHITRYLIYFGIALCSITYTVVMFLGIFADTAAVIKGNRIIGAINLTSDIYILCVPVMAASKLHLSLRKKVGLILIFMTGISACIMAIISLVYRLQVTRNEADTTYILATTVIVTTIENDVGLMCACMPFFPALVKNSPMLRKAFRSVQVLASKSAGSNSTSSSTATTLGHHDRTQSTATKDEFVELDDHPHSTERTLSNAKLSPRLEVETFRERRGSKWPEVEETSRSSLISDGEDMV